MCRSVSEKGLIVTTKTLVIFDRPVPFSIFTEDELKVLMLASGGKPPIELSVCTMTYIDLQTIDVSDIDLGSAQYAPVTDPDGSNPRIGWLSIARIVNQACERGAIDSLGMKVVTSGTDDFADEPLYGAFEVTIVEFVRGYVPEYCSSEWAKSSDLRELDLEDGICP